MTTLTFTTVFALFLVVITICLFVRSIPELQTPPYRVDITALIASSLLLALLIVLLYIWLTR